MLIVTDNTNFTMQNRIRMANIIKEKILSSRVGVIGILVFSVYTFAWGVVEPLNLDWINNNKDIWRVILLAFSAFVTIILSMKLSGSLLDKIDTEGLDRTLQGSYSSTGNPQMKLLQDGRLGNVIRISGDFESDEADWIIKGCAQKSKKMEFIFKSDGKIDFYLRVGIFSQNGESSSTRSIRFDNTLTSSDPYVPDTPELGVPYDSTPLQGFNKVVIDIPDAVRQSFGQGGWTYGKIMIFRIRCYDATIKSVSFQK